MADLSVTSNPAENDCDGGVINPIGPLDSSIEPEEEDKGGISVEHSPDTNIDNDSTCVGSDEVTDYVPPMSESSSSTQPEDDAQSLYGRCHVIMHRVLRRVRCMYYCLLVFYVLS